MAYTADGVLGAENYDVLRRRLEMMQVRLDHSNERYHRARELLTFYQAVGAEDARSMVERYRTALQQIVDLEPDMHYASTEHDMAAIAKRALLGR